MIPSSLPCTHYYYRFNLPSIKSFTVTISFTISIFYLVFYQCIISYFLSLVTIQWPYPIIIRVVRPCPVPRGERINKKSNII